METLKELAVRLFEIEAVKFGDFKLKSGIQSPIYFDLRVIISFPDVMVKVSELLFQASKNCLQPYSLVCGVPYTALPLSTIVSISQNIPMVMRRKEAKGYGTKKMIEGRFSAGDVCLVIEDVVTSGASVLETVEALTEEGIVVRDAVVLLDRGQGGAARLKQNGIALHSVIPVADMLTWLTEAGKIDQSTVDRVNKFIDENQCPAVPENVESKPAEAVCKVLSHSERAALCQNPSTKRLFEIMSAKKTNLALSADVALSEQLLKLADEVGPEICVLKTHVDELVDFSEETVTQLKELAAKHNFLIFEDRKFADIGHTVQQQFESGLYHISSWADIIDAHSLPGPGIIEGLKQVDASKGCLLIAEMSSKGNLITEGYTKSTVQIAENHRDFVIGFICQKKLSEDPRFVHMTPGVHMESSGDSNGQQYVSPQEAICTRRSDVIIVGRGITKADDPRAAARLYREAAYNAYIKCV